MLSPSTHSLNAFARFGCFSLVEVFALISLVLPLPETAIYKMNFFLSSSLKEISPIYFIFQVKTQERGSVTQRPEEMHTFAKHGPCSGWSLRFGRN